jgi:serine/threonine protein kinase
MFKLTDFGLAKDLDLMGSSTIGDAKGTPLYMAPELFDSSPDGRCIAYSNKSDMYAFAVTFDEMLSETEPTIVEQHGNSLSGFQKAVRSGQRPPRFIPTPSVDTTLAEASVGFSLVTFIECAFDQYPDYRPSFKDAVEYLRRARNFLAQYGGNSSSAAYFPPFADPHYYHHRVSKQEGKKVPDPAPNPPVGEDDDHPGESHKRDEDTPVGKGVRPINKICVNNRKDKGKHLSASC